MEITEIDMRTLREAFDREFFDDEEYEQEGIFVNLETGEVFEAFKFDDDDDYDDDYGDLEEIRKNPLYKEVKGINADTWHEIFEDFLGNHENVKLAEYYDGDMELTIEVMSEDEVNEWLDYRESYIDEKAGEFVEDLQKAPKKRIRIKKANGSSL